MQPTDFVWRDGEFVPWAKATTHVMTHALHYGSAVFEGIRAYDTKAGTRFFRLREHLARLADSARIYGMPMRWSIAQLGEACQELLRKNRMRAAYVRPLVFRGYATMGLDPSDCPVETVVACWDWARYFAGKDRQEGVDVCISSWRRAASSTLPPMAKAAGNYLSSQLIRLEAKRDGYAEGIALTTDGFVGEASGENVFVVKGGVLFTPDAGSSILLGVTRDAAITLARDLGLEVREQRLPRELLLVADEIFLTGTAAEITPVRSVDRTMIGDGRAGPLTRSIQQRFYGLFDGSCEDRHGWLAAEVPSPSSLPT